MAGVLSAADPGLRTPYRRLAGIREPRSSPALADPPWFGPGCDGGHAPTARDRRTRPRPAATHRFCQSATPRTTVGHGRDAVVSGRPSTTGSERRSAPVRGPAETAARCFFATPPGVRARDLLRARAPGRLGAGGRRMACGGGAAPRGVRTGWQGWVNGCAAPRGRGRDAAAGDAATRSGMTTGCECLRRPTSPPGETMTPRPLATRTAPVGRYAAILRRILEEWVRRRVRRRRPRRSVRRSSRRPCAGCRRRRRSRRRRGSRASAGCARRTWGRTP